MRHPRDEMFDVACGERLVVGESATVEAAGPMIADSEAIAIVGLGYVGLPLAVEFGKLRPVVGFDIATSRIAELQSGKDATLEVGPNEMRAASKLRFSSCIKDIAGCRVFIVTVPTPVDLANRPDLSALIAATETVGRVMSHGAIVIYESTVYPGATEEVCVPVLERVSGKKFNVDFFCGYSPERINPGDKERRLSTIKKVTSGSTPDVADAVDRLYGQIVSAGTHKASSIKVAEAAKVIENTQRDLNIALMNELSLIFRKLGIDTLEVLQAAGTKWNFLPFRPGLVGGHCIGVDPYYLTHKAEQVTEWRHTSTRQVDHVIGAFYLVRRSLFDSLNGFDERFFVYLEDLDLSLRVHRAGWRCVYYTGAQAFHAGGGTSRQVKAARLFYALRSRLLYGFKHFSPPQAWIVLGVTLLLEPVPRLLLSLWRGSLAGARDT